MNWKYTPTEPGEYKVVLKQKVPLPSNVIFPNDTSTFQDAIIRTFPFTVSDLTVSLYGAGVNSGKVGQEAKFGVSFLDKPNGLVVPAGGTKIWKTSFLGVEIILIVSFSDTFEAIVVSPDGKKVVTNVTMNKNGSCGVSYTPLVEGPHTVTVKRRGSNAIDTSIFPSFPPSFSRSMFVVLQGS